MPTNPLTRPPVIPVANPGRHMPKLRQKDPQLNNDLQIIYKQFYDLKDQHDATVAQLQQAQQTIAQLQTKLSGPYPPGSGPIDSMVLGLPVQPIDAHSLADGTKLTFVKASGNFQFK